MRLWKGLLVSLVAAGLAGCSSGTSGPPAVPTPTITATASSVPPASPHTKALARAAAEQFYGLYAASQYTALWNLLASTTKHQVSRKAWVGVHEACSSAEAGKSRVIKAVTVFGNAAIVAETVSGAAARHGRGRIQLHRWPLAVLTPGPQHLPTQIRHR